jgi:hypothetical protein
MKAKTIFSILGAIHIAIGLALAGMAANADEALKQWIDGPIEADIMQLIVGQLRVVTVHSVGAGLIMLMARGMTSTADARRVLKGYCLFCGLVLLNAGYGALFATAPPIPVIVMYIVGFGLAAYGSAKAEVG